MIKECIAPRPRPTTFSYWISVSLFRAKGQRNFACIFLPLRLRRQERSGQWPATACPRNKCTRRRCQTRRTRCSARNSLPPSPSRCCDVRGSASRSRRRPSGSRRICRYPRRCTSPATLQYKQYLPFCTIFKSLANQLQVRFSEGLAPLEGLPGDTFGD